MQLRPIPKKLDPLERLLGSHPAYQAIPLAILPHARAVPLGVMVRGTMEWLLDEDSLRRLFREHAPEHYERELTLSSLVGLLIQVSAGARASVFAAYQADTTSEDPTIATSYQAVYGKLGRINPTASESLVRFSAQKLGELLDLVPVATPEALPGYRLRVLDGNVLAGTDHRLKPLRKWLNACLPGKSLVVYEPSRRLVTDLVLCEDAYTQERALLKDILPRVQAGELWLADRNFCTTAFVFGVCKRQGSFLVRQHSSNLPCKRNSRLVKCGQTDTGTVWEQTVTVTHPDTGEKQTLRRIEIRLFQMTRDGDRAIAVLTNVPDTISAVVIAELYRQRWTIEQQFQFLTESLHCELKGLGKPRASLFAFCMALVAANVLAVVRGSLRAAHGIEVENEISGYYLADEAAGDYRTVMKYLPPEQWQGWWELDALRMVRLLTVIAQSVNVAALKRHRRGPKKPPEDKPIYSRKHTHYSSARLLSPTQDSC
jgi:IS4 transposase